MDQQSNDAAYLQLLLNSTAAAFYAVDQEGITTHCNDAFLKLLGFKSLAEVIGKKLHGLIHHSRPDGSHYPVEECPIYNSAKHGQRNHVSTEVFFDVNNKPIPVEYWAYPIVKNGVQLGSVCTFIDISNRKKNDERIRRIIDTALDAFVMIDKEGFIHEWNKQAETIFGWTHEEAMGQQMSELIIPTHYRSAHHNGMTHYITTGEHNILNQRIEITALNKAGDVFPIELTVTSQHYEDEVFFNAFVRDITKQKEAEQQLIEARNIAESANLAKTEFLANMSHEIRTPMNAVIGLSHILGTSQPLTAKQKEFIRTLQLSADSLLSLINDLLDIAKIETRTIELESIPFNMTQMVQEVISIMSVRARGKGLYFTMNGECVNDRMFIGDPTRLRQIVMNLCSNAVKFTETGGIHVEILCHPTEIPEVEKIHILVKDTGIGIASEKIETIFEKFAQGDSSINRKYGGTGLGLAITKTLTEIMGGTIEVQSTPGEGSTFTICLHLTQATERMESNPESNQKSNVAEKPEDIKERAKILIVEDYAPNVMVIKSFIEDFGFTGDVASNGAEAFELLKIGEYTAVLMDVQMHGMNGLEATQYIRNWEKQNGRHRVPIIGVTAHATSGDRDRCLSAGMDDYVSKPFNPSELYEKILLLI